MRIKPETIVTALVVFVSLWFVAVVIQGLAAGQGWWLIPVNYQLSGQFGDSFGALGAAMAAAAAIGAWQAVSDQRASLLEAKARESQLQYVAAKRDFETTYFNLLNTFERIVAQIDVGGIIRPRTGKDAFSYFVEELHRNKVKNDPDFRASYERVFQKHRNDLAHYLRTLFNIVQFVKAACPEDSYFYVRLVRATLSEPELVILALNGLYHPEGERNFKPLVEEFALLNNISDSAKADYDLTDRYEPTAFERGEKATNKAEELNGNGK